MKELVASLTAWGASGLFVIALLDGAGLPIPGGVDVLIVFLASKGSWSVLQLSLTAVIGSTLGNLLLFALARRGGQVYLDKRTQSASAQKFRNWFHHYGLVTVFVAALVPLPVMPMKIFVLCAGALGSPVVSFVSVFVAARLIRYSGLAYVGYRMGANALPFLRSHVWSLTAFACALFLVLYLVIKVIDKRREAATAR